MDKEAFPHTGGNQNHVSVVFIGDSNHAVSPSAGNGANMALKDGWSLQSNLQITFSHREYRSSSP
ncbi:hypothetical protein LIPSTDRAFT_107393 [Lipomyces starkeyi NRRL Y-11557]|uniref:FAD-binding domain-containing protein n=1 Tax=Lipomyces starkeyi NRRL Y-11557 TaxID=675824 RepID=A0A1E3PZB7_LIPST|nr:hypothetical protein LIPSTDRAFT_107393 [Lipomyces starkeyi NRRL Y-11557]